MIKDAREFYPILCDWWKLQKWPVIPTSWLPRRGYVAFVNDKPALAAFLAKEESCKLGMLEFLVGNPALEPAEREAAAEELFPHIVKEAGGAGVEALWAVSSHESFTKKLAKYGFMTADFGHHALMLKKLGG